MRPRKFLESSKRMSLQERAESMGERWRDKLWIFQSSQKPAVRQNLQASLCELAAERFPGCGRKPSHAIRPQNVHWNHDIRQALFDVEC